MQATYKVIQTTVSELPAQVEYKNNTVTANIPSLVVQLQPLDNQDNNSVIKLVFPNQTEQEPFVFGNNVTVTFTAE